MGSAYRAIDRPQRVNRLIRRSPYAVTTGSCATITNGLGDWDEHRFSIRPNQSEARQSLTARVVLRLPFVGCDEAANDQAASTEDERVVAGGIAEPNAHRAAPKAATHDA